MDNENLLSKQFKMTDDERIDKEKDLYTTINPNVGLQALNESGYLDALEVMMEPILNNFDDHSP